MQEVRLIPFLQTIYSQYSDRWKEVCRNDKGLQDMFIEKGDPLLLSSNMTDVVQGIELLVMVDESGLAGILSLCDSRYISFKSIFIGVSGIKHCE